jgi:predicted Rossmann-fold nucleotide-binding protein
MHASQPMVSLGNEAEVLDLVANSILGLWDVVNSLTRLRPTHRERYRVTIFGSARIPEDHWVYAAVRDVSKELTRMGCDIITGGGPGLMAAANEGTRRADSSARTSSVGIRVQLPFE